MESVLASLSEALNSLVKSFVQKLSDKEGCELSEEELLKVWEEVAGSKLPPPSNKRRGRVPKENKPQCVHKNKSGKNVGKQCSSFATEGDEYCSRHRKQVDKSVATKTTTSSKPKVEKPEMKPIKVVLDKSTKRYVNPQTKIVFDKESKKAVGKQTDTGELVDLNSKDVETCIANGWDYKMPDVLSSDGEEPAEVDDREDETAEESE